MSFGELEREAGAWFYRPGTRLLDTGRDGYNGSNVRGCTNRGTKAGSHLPNRDRREVTRHRRLAVDDGFNA